MNNRERIVISVGGSLISTDSGLNLEFLRNLNSFLRVQLEKYPKRQFFLVIGGGATARDYRDAGKQIIGHELTDEDLDWIGLHATRLNAHLVKTIFREIVHYNIIRNYDIIRKVAEPVILAAGWKPGLSTDYCATILCEDYHVDQIINLGTVSYVFDKDPRKFSVLKPLKQLSWKEFFKVVGTKHLSGMHIPFDPNAAKKAKKLGVKVIVMNGNDFANVEKYLKGESFVGTIIQ